MNSEIFKAKSGKEYRIELDDGDEISVWFGDVKQGTISLRRIEGAEEGPGDLAYDYYHITHLALDACKGQGIGRRCLQFHQEVFEADITAGNYRDGQMDDGSHLTGDGPGFIAKMRAEGLVVDDEVEHLYTEDDR